MISYSISCLIHDGSSCIHDGSSFIHDDSSLFMMFQVLFMIVYEVKSLLTACSILSCVYSNIYLKLLKHSPAFLFILFYCLYHIMYIVLSLHISLSFCFLLFPSLYSSTFSFPLSTNFTSGDANSDDEYSTNLHHK